METRTQFVLRWIVGTIGGLMLSTSVAIATFGMWEVLSTVLPFSTPQQFAQILFMLLLLAAALAVGASFGFAQWRSALRGKLDKRVWMIACGTAFVTGTIGAYAGLSLDLPLLETVSGNFSGIDTRYQIQPSWLLSAIVIGTAIGLAVSIPQWFVLRRYSPRAGLWLPLNVASSIIALSAWIAFTSLIGNVILSWSFGCCVGPILFHGVVGIGLFSLLKRPKPNQDTIEPEIA